MFIAGAQDGSWLLLGPNAVDALGAPFGLSSAIEQYLLDPLFDSVGFSYERPATTELSPVSSWYQWANSDDRPLPGNIGYYNAYGSVTLQEEHCYLFVTACHTVSLFGIGDGVLMTGTNDPYDTAWEGGAKFSRPDTVEQWQFEYDRNVVLELSHVLSSPVQAIKDFVNGISTAPELHTNVRAQTHDVTVRSCTAEANVRLDDQYLDIIRGKLNLEPYTCPTH
jgi:hypothetical protein